MDEENPADSISKEKASNSEAEGALEERVVVLSKIDFAPPAPLKLQAMLIEPQTAHKAISGDKPFHLADGSVHFQLISPTFISYIEVESENTSLDAQPIVIDRLGASQAAKFKKISHKVFRAFIGSVCRSVTLQSIDGRFLKGKTQIKSVDLYGYVNCDPSGWIEKFEELHSEVEYCRSELTTQLTQLKEDKQRNQKDLEALRIERESQQSKLQALGIEIRAAEEAIKIRSTEKESAIIAAQDSEKRLSEINSAVATQNSLLEELKVKQSESRRDAEVHGATSLRLLEEIAKRKSDLEQLNKDVSFFAHDLKLYGEQGKRQVDTCIVIIMLGVVSALYIGNVAFWELDKIWDAVVADPSKIAWSLIAITRFGMILVFAALVGGLISIVHRFINRIIQIQERALDLSAVSVLAKDVTYSSITDPTADENKKMAVFYASRMALVRNLLAGLFEKLAESKKEERDGEIEKFTLSDISMVAKILSEKVVDALKKV